MVSSRETHVTQQPGPADARGGGQFWRARNFMLFFVATSASTLGSAMVSVALTFAVLSHGHSAMILGVVLAAQAAPVVVLMVPAGAVADLWPRRSLMVGADLLRCASQGLTAVLMAGAHPSVAALVALVALVGIGNAFYGPAESGLIPVLARPEDLRRVNSLLSLSGSITAILGPSLGGMLVAVGSAPIAIGCDALTYAVSATCLSFMRTMRPTRRAATPFHTHLLTGWREFHRRRWLILMTAQYGILNLAAFAPFLILGPVSLAGTPHGARSWGIISSAVGIGGIVGGVIILFWRASRPLILYELAASALIVPLFLLARQAPVPVVALGGIAFGAGMVILNLVAQTTIQRQVPEEALSRINALFGLVAQGLTPLSYAMCGFLARSVGTKPVLVAGCVVVGASVVVLLMCRETWQLRDVPA
ncbi:MFS transporter [Gluconacetobacter johannae]|uniref:MFS transporter n=1 Tax=Gluconacetobacter johannae TaxID=112140 RepID=A0A7W4J607_9PROT|nr:MFS transporter [Gluconacetobacter johannae]